MFIWRTADVIRDSSDVHEQSTSLHSQYNALIIVHYHFWIILAVIFFNIVFCSSLHWEIKEKGERLKHKPRYTETTTPLNDPKISIKHGVDVIHSISHLISANESRNTQFLNGAKKLEALHGFADFSFLVSGWNGIPMSFGSICDI